ncbi:MAG: tRNA (adenosine(37)-N6)-threonylcarbamoyltransferase complex dimerization subunit type 1 TsaB [Bacteroidales bacterium]|nr:tRNA (adenosine(37)-N6)-threonylcarbamoyltransferase complex dimerization subunit type 1 TsaB [Bacteroidales bacterium]
MSEPWLILETSGRGGRVGLARNGQIVGRAELDPVRRHNRDLAATVQRLLAESTLRPGQLRGVMVSIGPGSFTGLRVGVMSAKSLAWALDCELITVATFSAIASQTPPEAVSVDVIADALQGLIFVQSFRRTGANWQAQDDIRILPATEWIQGLLPTTWVSGPALSLYETALPPEIARAPLESRHPTIDAVYHVGLRQSPLSRVELLQLEPLYLRASSAEEKAARQG